MHASVFINHDLAIGERNVNVLRSHPVNRGIQLVYIACQLDDKCANLIWRNLGTNNIGCHVKVFRQTIRDWHLHRAFGKCERHPFFHTFKGKACVRVQIAALMLLS